nr:unnamed protein product [Spirometra erinaceieuropaei]
MQKPSFMILDILEAKMSVEQKCEALTEVRLSQNSGTRKSQIQQPPGEACAGEERENACGEGWTLSWNLFHQASTACDLKDAVKMHAHRSTTFMDSWSANQAENGSTRFEENGTGKAHPGHLDDVQRSTGETVGSGYRLSPSNLLMPVSTSTPVTQHNQPHLPPRPFQLSCEMPPKKKTRKARTAFSDHQLNELERTFERQKYLSVQDRMQLAEKLRLSDMQVKTWYQNRSIDSIEDCEPAPSSPAPKFPIGQAKSGGFQKFSAFGQSPVYKSPSVTTSSDRAEKEFSMRDFGNRKSPCLQKKPVDENLTEPEFTVDEEDDKREEGQVRNTPKEILEERKLPTPSPSVDAASASSRLERLPLLQLKLKNEALKLENWKNELVSNLQKKESVKYREKDLSQRIIEMKNEDLAKSRQINELTVVIENFKGENEKLKTEIENYAKSLRELEDAKRALDGTLMLSLQKQDELKEHLTVLEIRCKEQENMLSQENIKTTEQAAYVDKLLKKIESLEKEGIQIRTKLQETKNQAEFKNTKVEELENQLQERLRQLEELEDTIRINDTEKEEIQKSAHENLELVARKEAENAQLTQRLQLAEAERMAAIKRNDEIRAELLYAMEQQQQEMDKLLRLKDRELEGLRSTLAAQQNDSEKTAKKTKELSKQLNTKTQRVNKLEKENEQRANILKENAETLASLREELDSLRLNKEQLDEKVSAQERELQKLKNIEMEFKSFKHQVMENSPPASTQLPVEIETLVQQTPKSPLLSQRLNHLNLLKTPQKTPKGILKQPGSECKRRRVLLVSPDRSASPPPRAETAVYDVIDLDNEPEPRSRPITPKIRRTPLVGGRMSSQTRKRPNPVQKISSDADGAQVVKKTLVRDSVKSLAEIDVYDIDLKTLF